MPVGPFIASRQREQSGFEPSLIRAIAEHSANAAKGVVSGVLGVPADLGTMLLRPLGYSVPSEQVIGSSDSIGSMLGADIERASFMAGAIGAPDPKDVGKLAGILGDAGLATMLFHGSPFKFNRFDSSKIGTGEGAQSFGHGVYVAENPKVAKSYEKGNFYEVDVPDEVVGKMLDWDAPIGKEKAIIARNTMDKEFIEEVSDHLNVEPEEWTGAEFYNALVRYASESPLGRQKGTTGNFSQDVSEYLKGKGIPGIKYLDRGSRQAGEGTRNFVIFDEDLLTIRSRGST